VFYVDTRSIGTVLGVASPVAIYIVMVKALYSVLFRRWHWFHVFIGVATGGCSINSLCIVIGCRRVYYLVFDGVTVNTDIWAPTTDDER
jgi:hypothetical protein